MTAISLAFSWGVVVGCVVTILGMLYLATRPEGDD